MAKRNSIDQLPEIKDGLQSEKSNWDIINKIKNKPIDFNCNRLIFISGRYPITYYKLPNERRINYGKTENEKCINSIR